jgi:uncharacterized protein (DUF305 family)
MSEAPIRQPWRAPTLRSTKRVMLMLRVLAVASALAGCKGTAPAPEALPTREKSPAVPTAPAPEATRTPLREGDPRLPMVTELHQASPQEFDRAFMSEMIAFQQGSIEMSREVLAKTRRAQLKKVARAVGERQRKSIAAMTGWLKELPGKAPDPELREQAQQDTKATLDGFKADCRQDCDRAYLRWMKRHVRMGTGMLPIGEARAARPELKTLVGKLKKEWQRDLDVFSHLENLLFQE